MQISVDDPSFSIYIKYIDINFDPAKDGINIAKHGVSLAAAADLDVLVIVEDGRFAGEQRYRLYGTLAGVPHCLAAVLRDGVVRAISLRVPTQRSIAAMSNKPIVLDDDNPEWTKQDFARAKPLSSFPELQAALVKNKGGRPAGSNKEQIALRVDKDVVQHFRAGGAGWQSRMNEALRRAAGLR